jgi:hypothetical protein
MKAHSHCLNAYQWCSIAFPPHDEYEFVSFNIVRNDGELIFCFDFQMSMSAAGRNMIRKTKLAFRGKVLVKPPTIAVAAEDEVQGAVFEPESPRSRSILVERQQALERAEVRFLLCSVFMFSAQ